MAEWDSEQRTEQPTSKRREEARQSGRVAKSTDLAVAVSLVAVFLGLRWAEPYMTTHTLSMTKGYLGQVSQAPQLFEDGGGLAIAKGFLILAVGSALPIALLGWFFVVLAFVAQGVWLLVPQAVVPQWGRVSPLGGATRLVGLGSWLRGLGAGCKLFVVGTLLFLSIGAWLENVTSSGLAGGRESWDEVMAFGARLSSCLLALALLDYGLQRWLLTRSLRMTKAEIREEAMREEGDQSAKERRRRFLADSVGALETETDDP